MSGESILSEGLAAIAARLLNSSPDSLRVDAASATFTQLGGTSILGMHFVATAARDLNVNIALGRLLGPEPLAIVLSGPFEKVEPSAWDGHAAGDIEYPIQPDQRTMLISEAIHGGTAYHLLFTADLRGDVDSEALRAALGRLTDRHEALRSVVVRATDADYRVRVLRHWEPVIVRRGLPAHGGDPVQIVHDLVGTDSARLLRPFTRPPVVFVLTQVEPRRHLLSLLIHHVFADGWAIGQIWREFAVAYETAGGQGSEQAAPSPASLPLPGSDDTARAARRRAAQLSGAPLTIDLPTDEPRSAESNGAGRRLLFGLGPDAAAACDRLAADGSVTRSAVVLAAWALAVARRAGSADVLIGVPVANRLTEQAMGTVTNCARVVPVRCLVDNQLKPAEYLQTISAALAQAVSGAEAPLEDVVKALGASGQGVDRPAVVQIAFAVHAELVPEDLNAGNLAVTIHEGHCGGAAFELTLFVQQWSPRPRLAIEYATKAFAATDILDLADGLDCALTELATAPALGEVRAISQQQHSRLADWGRGEAWQPDGEGLWQCIERTAQRHPSAIAVSDRRITLTYAELITAVEGMSIRLTNAGVRQGDHVALSLPRSCEEIVAVLSVLRMGAVYSALDPDDPPARRAAVMRALAPRTLVVLDDAADDGDHIVVVATVDTSSYVPAPPAVHCGPGSPVYIAFTSGSTGAPKGVRITHGAVRRLVDWAGCLPCGHGERMIRLAPLAFDASTLEIFAPLCWGGAIEVAPAGALAPSDVAAVLEDRRISVAWLTAGLFRLMVEFELGRLAGLKHVLTGGDVVPADAVRTLLSRVHGLTVTNGYGPTENTTFTSTYSMTDPAQVPDSVPIGRPIHGTDVTVRDEDGRLVPPGAVGELYITGAGLAMDYLDSPEDTHDAFTALGYRTGDLVRWDTEGRLRFLGRRDRQVKIGGHRVELDEVRAAIVSVPGVRDAFVTIIGAAAHDKRIFGVICGDPLLRDRVAARCGQRLPAWSVPATWLVVGALPMTRNGKVDVAALQAAATLTTRAVEPIPLPRDSEADTVDLIVEVWTDVLGHNAIESTDGFFDLGGDSMGMLRVFERLQQLLPEHQFELIDLFKAVTPEKLGRLLDGRRP